MEHCKACNKLVFASRESDNLLTWVKGEDNGAHWLLVGFPSEMPDKAAFRLFCPKGNPVMILLKDLSKVKSEAIEVETINQGKREAVELFKKSIGL